jgi:hypothetical protein
MEIIKYTGEIYSKLRTISKANLAGLYMIMSKSNQEKCDFFFEKYGTGLDIHSKHPIYLLREKFIKHQGSKRKLDAREKIALFIKAWNAFMMNKEIGLLTFKMDETFPTII